MPTIELVMGVPFLVYQTSAGKIMGEVDRDDPRYAAEIRRLEQEAALLEAMSVLYLDDGRFRRE